MTATLYQVFTDDTTLQDTEHKEKKTEVYTTEYEKVWVIECKKVSTTKYEKVCTKEDAKGPSTEYEKVPITEDEKAPITEYQKLCTAEYDKLCTTEYEKVCWTNTRRKFVCFDKFLEFAMCSSCLFVLIYLSTK